MVVAIDGTVSSGKSTIAKKLAEHLNFLYCNTGAIYRAITVKILKEDLCEANDEKIASMLKSTVITMEKDGDNKLIIRLDGEDVSGIINTPKISGLVSSYSKIPEVREYVRLVQKQIAKKGNAVIEGRDIGTVVFPEAEVKIFMTADTDIRATRRYNDYIRQGKPLPFEEVRAQIIARDNEDMNRPISPLKPADDAVIYYNNGSDINKVIEDLASLVIKKQQSEEK